jgi:hypothetical protein
VAVNRDTDNLTLGTDATSDHGELDPQWEENRISEPPLEVENGGVPEPLEPVFIPTLRNRRRHGMIFSDGTPNIPDDEQMPDELSDSQELRTLALISPSSMDGAISVASARPRTESEPVRDESNANIFSSWRNMIGVSRRRPPQIHRPPTAMGSSQGANSGGQRPGHGTRLNNDPGTEICPE